MKKILLNKGKYALVDDQDFEVLSRKHWFSKSGGLRGKTEYAVTYISRNRKQKRIFMHRVIMGTPKGMDTDHINRNGLDNRRSNLRICTHAENLKNKRIYSNNVSGVSGVTWSKSLNRWMARVRFEGKEIYLGVFTSKNNAIIKVNKFRKTLAITA